VLDATIGKVKGQAKSRTPWSQHRPLLLIMVPAIGVFGGARRLGETPHRQDDAALSLCFVFGRRSGSSA